MWETISFKRDQLHDDVWSTPMSKLAKKYGVASSKIVEACEKLSVPRPPVGYWMKVAHGKAVNKVPLPPLSDNSPTEWELEAFVLSENQRRLQSETITLKMDHSKQLGEIVIPEEITKKKHEIGGSGKMHDEKKSNESKRCFFRQRHGLKQTIFVSSLRPQKQLILEVMRNIHVGWNGVFIRRIDSIR